jgi:hypothetical protein
MWKRVARGRGNWGNRGQRRGRSGRRSYRGTRRGGFHRRGRRPRDGTLITNLGVRLCDRNRGHEKRQRCKKEGPSTVEHAPSSAREYPTLIQVFGQGQ